MAFKEMSVEELADTLKVNLSEVREKQKLAKLIVKERKSQNLSQALLAKKVGVSQGRIAQIESGVGTSKITFDVLLNVLATLGFDFKIHAKRAA
jgi:predicted transcriptional regulator